MSQNWGGVLQQSQQQVSLALRRVKTEASRSNPGQENPLPIGMRRLAGYMGGLRIAALTTTPTITITTRSTTNYNEQSQSQ